MQQEYYILFRYFAFAYDCRIGYELQFCISNYKCIEIKKFETIIRQQMNYIKIETTCVSSELIKRISLITNKLIKMKNLILSVLMMAFVFTSCESNTTKSTEVSTEAMTVKPAEDHSAHMYSCSMHPEVTGHKGDKCSKCNMDLTEPVTKENGTSDNAQLYACSMHPDVIGKKVKNVLNAEWNLLYPLKSRNDYSVGNIFKELLKILKFYYPK